MNNNPHKTPSPTSPHPANTVSPPPTATGNVPGAPYREDPGQSYGIIGLVVNFLGIFPAGIVFGIISRNRSREANFSTVLGTISLVWGIVGTVLSVLAIIGFILIMVFASSASQEYRDDTPSSSPLQEGSSLSS